MTLERLDYDEAAAEAWLYRDILDNVRQIVEAAVSDDTQTVTDYVHTNETSGETEVTAQTPLNTSILWRKLDYKAKIAGFEDERIAENVRFHYFNPVQPASEILSIADSTKVAEINLEGEPGPNGRATQEIWILSHNGEIYYTKVEAPPSLKAFKDQCLAEWQTEAGKRELAELKLEHEGWQGHPRIPADFELWLESKLEAWHEEEVLRSPKNALVYEEDIGYDARQSLLDRLRAFSQKVA